MERKMDSVTFEVLMHRLESILGEGYYTIGRVSGSAVVYEAGDHQEAILTRDGELAGFGGGVLHWTPVMSQAVKHLIEVYGFDEIYEGDYFLQNDPYVGCLHAMDIQILHPIFYEGELVAWSATASHQSDTGGIDPGGFCIRATERFHEGFQSPGIKFIEKGKRRKDIEELFRNAVRTPDISVLDINAKIASCNVMEERLIEIIKSYGVDLVLMLFDQAINYSEQRVRTKLSEIPDGTWKAINYVEGITMPYFRVECTLIKEKDTLTFDFTGTSPQSPGSENLTAAGGMGSAVDPFFPMFCHDIPWNSGIFRPLKFILPEGSIVNATFPAAVSCNTPSGAAYITTATAQNALSKMLLSSEKYRLEACGNIMTATQFPVISGLNKEGAFYATLIMDGLAGGSGALPDRDGDNTGANMWSAKVMISNIETNELHFPILYILRKEFPDSGGPGKFRGGLSQVICFTPWKTDEIVNVHQGSGQEPRNSLGISGGYPAASSRVIKVKNSRIFEKMKEGNPPRSWEEIGGEQEAFAKGLSIFKIKPEEILCYSCGGGGGYGDPLNRELDLVLRDVINKDVSVKGAEQDYGVIIDPDKLEVNYKKTDTVRQEMRKERLTQGRR
jgi:N-methylhydantoinase B